MPFLQLTAIVVAEYDPAIAFFVDALGFELVEDSPALTSAGGEPKRWVVVRPPGAQTGILLARADGPAQEAAIGNQVAGRVGFFLAVAAAVGVAAFATMGASSLSNQLGPRRAPQGTHLPSAVPCLQWFRCVG